MKWRTGERSSNVEDRRGRGGGGMGIGGLGIGGIVIVTAIALLMGRNPLELLGAVAEQAPTTEAPAGAPPANDDNLQFVHAVTASTEKTWGKVFQASGSTYPAPKLVMFSGMVGSACGRASAAVGPFYCPGDRSVYLDTRFFEEMKAKLGGGGDFAQAYVIAHEVGHHVQIVTGTEQKVAQLRSQGVPMTGDGGLSVRQELQADCYAGVWASQAQAEYNWLEPGDIEKALATASAIGDDKLQQQSQGVVVPDSFTHGSAAQRVRWFKTGFQTADPGQCDTFSARQL